MRKKSERSRRTFEKAAASEQEHELAQTNFAQKEAGRRNAEAELQHLKNYVRPEDRALAAARVRYADAQLELVRQRLRDTNLVAPCDGTVLQIVKPDRSRTPVRGATGSGKRPAAARFALPSAPVNAVIRASPAGQRPRTPALTPGSWSRRHPPSTTGQPFAATVSSKCGISTASAGRRDVHGLEHLTGARRSARERRTRRAGRRLRGRTVEDENRAIPVTQPEGAAGRPDPHRATPGNAPLSSTSSQSPCVGS